MIPNIAKPRLEYLPKVELGKQVVCINCGKGGGTLIKVGDVYKHDRCPRRFFRKRKKGKAGMR